jgi:two-component sensor histidine kinase
MLGMDGKSIMALTHLQNALQLYQAANSKDLKGVYDLLGSVHVQLGDYKEGLRYGLLAARVAEELGDSSSMLSTIYNHVGISYSLVNQPDKAVMYFDKALVIAEKNEDLNSIAILIDNLADMLLKKGDPRGVLQLVDKMKRLHPLLEKNTEFTVDIGCIMVAAYTRLKQYDKAGLYCRQLEKLLDSGIPDSEQEADIYKRLFWFYVNIGNYTRAAQYVHLYDKFSKRLNTPYYREDSYLYKFKLDSLQGRYKEALSNFQHYKLINDTIFNEARSRQVDQLSILYETEKKDKDIRLLQQQAGLQQADLIQAGTFRNFILGAAVLLLVVVFLLYRGYKIKQRNNRVLQQHKEVIDQKNISLQKLVNEKEWLLKEIHHRVKNNLHMVVGLLASQSEFVKSDEAYMVISESQHRIQAMSLIHQKLYQTENLSSTHMPSYILELVDYLKSSFDNELAVRFTLDIDNVDFPLSHSIPIALILNEAIVNAIKYAFPGRTDGNINISLIEKAPQQFLLRIRDNGVGLPAAFSLKNNTSLGTTLMQGLSGDIGASFSMTSDHGTIVELAFTMS